MDREERIIRSTDFDALSCRVSAIQKGYLENDLYLIKLIQGYERFLKFEYKLSARRVYNSIIDSKKLPVINRGTYIRVISINELINDFINKFNDTNIRIINLGAGSDTRAFNILKEHKNVEYIEFDFPKSTKLKNCVIKTDKELSNIIGCQYQDPEQINLQTLYETTDPDLITKNYKLHSIDLRDTNKFQDILQSYDSNIPTLIISECMLCYTESKISNKIIKIIKMTFKQGSIIIYDPIGGDDRFGHVMIDNLNIRNIQMPSLLEFNTIIKYHQRLSDLGIDNVHINDMFEILNKWIDNNEKKRISTLEILDEIEELRLLLRHYCLIVGVWGFEWDQIIHKF